MPIVLRLLVPVTVFLGRAQTTLAKDYRESGRAMRLVIFWSWLPLRLIDVPRRPACLRGARRYVAGHA